MLVADCPKALADLVDNLLEKRPDDRPDNAAVVAEQLAGILSGELTSIDGTAHAADEDSSPDILQPTQNLTQRLQSHPSLGEKSTNWQLLTIVVAVVILVIAVLLATNGGN